MAVGLAGEGGGRGWMFRIGAVDARLNGGGGGGGGGGGVWLPVAPLLVPLPVKGKDDVEDDVKEESLCGCFGWGLVEACCCTCEAPG